MTGPVGPETPPPPPGPGRAEESIDGLTAWIDRVVAAAPEITDRQGALLQQVFGGRIESRRAAA